MKKALSTILGILLLTVLFGFSISAAEPTIKIDSATAKRGDTVTLDVEFQNNPGIATYSLEIVYDKTRLELVECENLLGASFIYGKRAVWYAFSDVKDNGAFLKLTFNVLENAPYGNASVTVSYDENGDICNYDEEAVKFKVKSGKVSIPGNHKHSYKTKVTKQATCTKSGVMTYACSCGYSYTETIPSGKHNSNTTIPAVAATFTKTGLTEGKKCSVCGTTTVKQKEVAKKRKVTGLEAKKVKVAKSSEIALAWTSLGEGVKYEVYVKNGSKWTKLTTTSKTSYTVKKDGKKKALKADKEYQFRVRAVVDGVKGSYSKVLTVKTVPATTTLKLKAGKKQLTASWSKVSDISGYEVQYSTSKKFTKKTTKTSNVKKSSKKTTVKKLSKGKKYYVRIRTYKTVNGKKIYSGWSTVKSVKVK